MDILLPIILGLVEGITEFLPVSSTAHLVLAGEAIGFDTASAASFEIAIQFAAILAVLFFEASRIREFFQSRQALDLTINLVIAFVPVAVFGLLAHDFIIEVLFAPGMIALAMIFGGGFMIWAERRFDRHVGSIPLEKITRRQAFAVGFAQVCSLFPGTSRAMTTIFGGMLAGISRAAATEFSFFLALPVLGAASFYELFLSSSAVALRLDQDFVIPFIVAFISAYLVLRLFYAFVSRHDFRIFAWYRIAFGFAILGFIYFG